MSGARKDASESAYEDKSQQSLFADRESLRSENESGNNGGWLGVTLPFPLPNVLKKQGHDSEEHAPRRSPRILRFPLKLPSTDFPNQGPGRFSEFFINRPIWSIEPFRTLYSIAFLMYMLFLYVPFKSIVNLPRANRPRRSWSWKKSMLVAIIRRCTIYMCKTYVPLAGKPSETVPVCRSSLHVYMDPSECIEPNDGEKAGDIRGELARAMRLQHVATARISGYFVSAWGDPIPTKEKAEENERILVHMHGGAYWMGTAQEKSVCAAFCRDILTRLKGDANAPHRAFLVEYRLARHSDYEHGSYPAALIDAVVAYLYLVRKCGFRPENIVLSGDSSGGNLALALCRYLRDEGLADVPAALLLLSPWCDISRSHSGPLRAPNPFSTTVLNKTSDVISTSMLYRNSAVSCLLGRLPASEAYTNPYISPVSLQLDSESGVRPPHWGFFGFPKHVFINTGRAEINSEQHITLAHRMAEGTLDGVPRYSGDSTCSPNDAHVMAWRDNFPRTERWVTNYDAAVQQQSCDVRPLEERQVVLDEASDGIHIYPIFRWFEPERSETLDRIAQWVRSL